MEDKIENLEFFSKDSWFKVLGIGEKGCKIVSELSKKRHYLLNDEFLSIRKEDFICIKGLRNIDELQNYLLDGSVVWYVTSSGKAYQDVLKEVLKVTSPKVDYSLLFSVGEIDRSFVYSLIARGYINHSIETIGGTHNKTLKIIEGLLFFLFGFSIIGVDFCDMKLAFSISPFIKADVIDIPRKNIGNFRELELLFKNLKEPASILLSSIISRNGTLNDAYKLATFIKRRFKKSILKEKQTYEEDIEKIIRNLNLPLDDSSSEVELFFFSVVGNETLEEDTVRAVIFWTEKELF